MDMNIFATNGDTVETYFATVNEKKLKQVQDNIDCWSGKGEIKEQRSSGLMPSEPLSKIEIISQKPDGTGEIFYYCCPTTETVNMYKYKYYEFKPHRLSRMCDQLLKDYKPIEFSKHIAAVFNWESQTDEEQQFANQILETISFEKVNIDDIIQSDISLIQKQNILQRLKAAIKKTKQSSKIIMTPLDYENEVEKQISSMESFNSGFYSRELKGQDFKYTPQQKVAVKRMIFESLPQSKIIQERKS